MVKEGVIAWAKSGDPDTGEWDDDAEILFKPEGLGALNGTLRPV
jgi:hypothetical protein